MTAAEAPKPRGLAGADPVALVPLAVGLALLLAALFWGDVLALAPSSPAPVWVLALLAGGAFVGASHRPLGSGSLGLGSTAIAPLVYFFGASPAAIVAGAVPAIWRLVRSRRAAVRALADGGWMLTATLAAAIAWRLLEAAALPVGAAVAAAVYLGVAAALFPLVARVRPPSERGAPALGLLALDALGWVPGAAGVAAIAAAGWVPGTILVLACCLLAGEAARGTWLRSRAARKIRELERVTQAGHRIISRSTDLERIAQQILIECRTVLPGSWSEVELASPAGRRSWWAGPEGRVEVGRATPPERPPALPGLHRRRSWRLIERWLETHGERRGRLRVWSDPRRLDAAALELLDNLVPQMASSIERAVLDQEARHDPLTGLPDRRALEARLATLWEDCRERGSSMAVILCDLDRFKRINDRYGHGVGDAVLVRMARLLEAAQREGDLCCRYGGEEFAVVLEESDGETALAVAERLRHAVELEIFEWGRRKIPLSVSAGVAAFPALHASDPQELVALADDALYKAKRSGRNRCLLNLGRGRFQRPDGSTLEPDEPPGEIRAPTLFS